MRHRGTGKKTTSKVNSRPRIEKNYEAKYSSYERFIPASVYIYTLEEVTGHCPCMPSNKICQIGWLEKEEEEF